MEDLQEALKSSSTSRRISELGALNESLAENATKFENLPHILNLLFSTYPIYNDRPSRQAVQRCLRTIFKNCYPLEDLAPFVAAVRAETSKLGIASSNAFILVEWCSLLEQELAGKPELWNKWGLDVMTANSYALETCLGSDARDSLKHSALVVTRRGIRRLLSGSSNGPSILDTAITKLSAKGTAGTFKHAVYLGLIAGVLACTEYGRLLSMKHVDEYYGFYVREIIGSKTKLSPHIANGLKEFFSNFATEADLQKEVVPALEKALLRAPEIVLNDLVCPLIEALPLSIDLSNIIQGNLLKPLLSNIKSTNPAIRSGALSTFQRSMGRCKDENSLEKISDEILSPLKTSKLASAEQRTLHAQMLSYIPRSTSLATQIPQGLAAVAVKEPNEAAAGAISIAVAVHLAYGLSQKITVNKVVSETFVKGLSDKRPSIRRLWALRVGWIVINLDKEELLQSQVQDFIWTVIEKMLEAWSEVVANPLSAVQSGLITTAYVVTALFGHSESWIDQNRLRLSGKRVKVSAEAVSRTPKPSFLLSHKIYSKVTSQEDLEWIIRALATISLDLSNLDLSKTVQELWAQAFLYLISAPAVRPVVRRHATASLTGIYIVSPSLIGGIVIDGIWTWVKNLESGEKDSAAVASKAANDELSTAVRAICLPPDDLAEKGADIDQAVLKSQLVQMVVLCRSEFIPRISWIETCQRTGVDPGKLVEDRSKDLLENIRIATIPLEGLSRTPYSELLRRAACNAAAELAFVAPTVFTPLLVHEIETNVNVELLKGIGPTEAAIYRTPDGTAFIDVLDKRPQAPHMDKSSKEYDILKWEEDLRTQLAKKKGLQKKLTHDEQSKVNAQLAQEARIRENISLAIVRLQRGVGLIYSLATGPPTQAEVWIGPAIRALLEVINAGAGLIIGDAAYTAYLSCAEQVTTRLGTVRPFIGVATLRASEVSQLRPELQQEPLGDLVTRVLYRLRFSGEQRPFDTVSCLYMLPLIFLVLRNRGIGKIAEEEVDEQIVLALEFLSFHTETCKDTHLPREEILRLLITSMQKYNQHYKIIKDCLLDLCRSIAQNATEGEIKVLVQGTIVPEISVRNAVLQFLNSEIDLIQMDFYEEIWLACHDDVDENVHIANSIWEENGLETDAECAGKLLTYLGSPDAQLRRAAARALADITKIHKRMFKATISKLQSSYQESAKPKKPTYDEFGMPKKMDLVDPWEARSGVALAFKELSSIFEDALLVPFIQFLINEGPLKDPSATVRDQMVDAATAIIAVHGKNKVEELMRLFEVTLEASDQSSVTADYVNEAVIVLYGALARHLKQGDGRIPKVVQRLLTTLSTPSESVQYAVANCLPPLIRASSPLTSTYVQDMIDQLFQSKKFAARRGAAYGIAGIVQGRGISALKDFRIMSTLKGGIENKKDANARQGALFAYELLSSSLGRVFEPYVIQIVPQLLSSFGDSSTDVRDACLDAAKACFASLSSYGVKQILPTLLEGLEDQQWRSKKGACDLLGAMAYLDPQQLAASLPVIIPPLTNVLNDSHKEVRLSANRSLQRFGEVISNPEVKSLVGILLKALSDPTKYTEEALNALIKVSFIHYLDSPSLALVVRILERGLGDRSVTKRKSAQIIGSLAHLTERKDLISHLPILVAGLKIAVVDPVPTTRATASKALGSLIEKLGEDALPDLIPSLMATLRSDTGAGDRLGSAQALSEVLAGLGTGRLEETLPTILQNVSSSKPSVREGFMSLFIFLPACFGNSFASYLNRIIPPILTGLADEIESIRDTSLRAGRLVVKNFATKAIDLLLPELERGLADDSYRIRLSSVELVGDLLFNLTGISTKVEDDDVGEGAMEAGQSLLDVLGEEKRNKVLSSLYICRCDTSGLVRSAAIGVWKALVASPRTLKELVPTLTQLIIRRLANPNTEQQHIAGNALGELIRKAGEGVLATLLPTLEEGLLTSTDSDAKQGICIALRELISSASPEALEDYEKTLISVVKAALIDPDEEVREAAAEAFDSLQRIFGKKAVDQVLPYLLHLLRTEGEADNALSALLTLLTENSRSSIILPNLLPTLLTPPITLFNARAISSLAEVAGSAMNRRLPTILNALMDNLISAKDPGLSAELSSSFDSVLQSVDEYDGLNTAMSVMLSLIKHDDHKKRAAAAIHLGNFFANTDIDYSRYNQDLIRVLLISFDDRDHDVVKAAWAALSELTERLKKEEKETLVFSTRQILQQVGVAGSSLPGFALPKGVGAILPIFVQGLMNGTADQRTQSALAISDIVDRSDADSLKPFVTQITGLLIRVVSERSTDVRAAILLALNNLLERIPTLLKRFLPQLQRTFAKSLADPSSEVLRNRAAQALGTLITFTPRIDPLVAELVTGSKFQDPGVKTAMLKALYEVVSKAGSNMSETSRASVLALIDTDLNDADDAMAITSAKLLGALIKNLSLEKAAPLIKNRIVTMRFSKASVLALNAVLVESPQSLTESTFADDLPKVICHGITSKETFVADNSVLASGKYLLTETTSKAYDTTKSIMETLSTVIHPGNPLDTRRLALVVVRTVGRLHNELVKPHLATLAPSIFTSVRDPVIPIKLSAEAAFLALFSVVELEGTVFDKYLSGPGSELPSATKRSMQDYFKRVALRLGAQARERKEAEGGQGGLGLSSDEVDDEKELWSVGKVELGNNVFVEY